MKKYFHLLLLLILPAGYSSAQTFQIGFRAESYLLSTSQTETRKDIYPFLSWYETLGLKFNKKFTLELRGGFLWDVNDYGGYESGLFTKYFVLNETIYLAGGYQLHFNDGGGHGTVTNGTKPVQFLSFGAGVQNKYFIFDVMGYLPVQSTYASSLAYSPTMHFAAMKVDYLIKATIGFEFSPFN